MEGDPVGGYEPRSAWARDIAVAGDIAELKAALPSLKGAVDQTNAMLREHVSEQRMENSQLKTDVSARFDKLEAKQLVVDARVSALELLHAKEDAVRAKDSARAGWAHKIFGGAITGGIMAAGAAIWSFIQQARHPVAALAVSGTLLCATGADAATYYVACGTGSNSAAGSSAAPWATITYASSKVVAGDTVIVKPGTCVESVRAQVSGQPASPITYRAETRGAAKIVPPANNTAEAAWEQGGSNVVVDGFEIDGSAHQSGTRWKRGISVLGQQVTVAGNIVHDIGRLAACTDAGYGIGAPEEAGYVTMHANTVRAVGNPTCGQAPAAPTPVWADEFDALSIAGVNESAVWFPWYKGWNVHALDGNSDKGWKDYDEHAWAANGTSRTLKQIIEAGDPTPAVKARYLHEVSGGTLKLRCYKNGDPEFDSIWWYSHSCGMISSEEVPSRAAATGYWETRMKINSLTKGQHLAIWLVPQDSSAYPPEIDVGEWINDGGDNTVARHFMNIHGETVAAAQTWDTVSDPNGWKTYGLEITPTKIRWYRDGELRREDDNRFTTDELTNEPAQPLAFMISPEHSGNWPGLPDGTTVYPLEAEIDYVRYYGSKP